jgi:hypothetical protein
MLLDFEQFRFWLLSQPAGRIVGYAFDDCYCPLAKWLREVSGRSGVRVCGTTYTLGGYQYNMLPTWATSFVLGIDRMSEAEPGPAILREEALSVLECCREV